VASTAQRRKAGDHQMEHGFAFSFYLFVIALSIAVGLAVARLA
jgi:hypothetical protein